MENEKNGKALAGMILGIVGMLAWIIPLIGLPVTIVGLVLSIQAVKANGRQGMAIAGIVLSGMALMLTIANSALGAYLGATGQL